MEIHLDLVGGFAGDMFIAALLDAFPQHEAAVQQAIRSVSDRCPVTCALAPHNDTVIQGHRFEVSRIERHLQGVPFTAPAVNGSGIDSFQHAHASWTSIRTRLEAASLCAETRSHAIGIFQLLANAEAAVHGVSPEEISFHEVGAWDSIADIVGAAELIHTVAASRWTTSPAPLGSGRVRTAHGILPVPAPATVQLLTGMATLDDGIPGERVTPTGAAILRYLCPPGTEQAASASKVRLLQCAGTGFGTRALPGLSNHVRVLCFEDSSTARGGRREIDVLEFEVDDQSAEDLALGLERLRAHEAVLDVTQTPVFGKKGRMMTHIRVLARQPYREQVMEACFRETTTIGLRHRTVQGVGLKRRTQDVTVDGHSLRVKIVERPGGASAKVESDDVISHEGHAARAALRSRGEQAALNCAGWEPNA